MAAQLALESRKSSAPAASLPVEDASASEEATAAAEREEAEVLEESADEIERGTRAVGGV
jgi:hypothetical protein